jgi:hypothetical protein
MRKDDGVSGSFTALLATVRARVLAHVVKQCSNNKDKIHFIPVERG